MDFLTYDFKIMVVDDSLTNLKVAKTTISDLGDVLTVPSAAKMFELLKIVKPSLILLDINMPEMDGLTAMKLLKQSEEYQDIPVLFLTANSDVGSEIQGLTLGAVDYITKPFEPFVLRKRVEIHLTILQQRLRLENQSKELKNFNENLQELVALETEKVLLLQDTVMDTFADLVEGRDDTTGGHIKRTMKWLTILMEGLTESGIYHEIIKDWDVKLFIQSSRLHDVGKIGISDAILKKPAKLTSDEFDEMKKHTLIGAQIIDKISESLSHYNYNFLNNASIMALTHHEKWDGTGYPHGIAGEDIPLQGRLMAISDVYDALISKRPYKEPQSPNEAMEIIVSSSGSNFDPLLIEIFKKMFPKFLVS
jgi:putative two-component system response regulator